MSSGTCPPSLLDRLERLATRCPLTVLAGGATAGGSRCPVKNPATPRSRGSLLANVWCGSTLTRQTAAEQRSSQQGRGADLDLAHGYRHRRSCPAPGQLADARGE